MLNVTISAGVAEMSPEDDALSLVARADAALYEAKHKGVIASLAPEATVLALVVSAFGAQRRSHR